MKYVICLLWLSATVSASALDPDTVKAIWPTIQQSDIVFYGSKPQVQLWYDPTSASRINESDEQSGLRFVLKFKSAALGKDLFVGIGGPAGRIGLIVSDRVTGHEPLLNILGNQMVVPGNDTIYVTRWNFFNPMSLAKYTIDAAGMHEVKQALNPTNAKDVARVSFAIYADRTSAGQLVGSIREGATVLVVGFTTDNYDDLHAQRWCLIASELGLLGWAPVTFIDKWVANHQPAMLRLFDNDTP